MGFGLSYSLPVVVAGLVAPQRDALLIVENPEAHLHPAGQSRMGTFLATVAATGVQVLETHSDHVLNGIRRAIGEHGVLQPADALVHFFDAKEDGEPQAPRCASRLGRAERVAQALLRPVPGGRRRAGEGAPRGGE